MTAPMNVRRLKIRSTDDPLLTTVARMVNPPTAEAPETLFIPAYGGFDIAEGHHVDVSYFYEPPSDRPWQKPRNGFDRHLRTEELWLVVEGDIWLPLGPCRNLDNPEDVPRTDDMLCFQFKQGDLFVLKPNVWHCGPWPLRAGKAVRFYMMLSGHRKAASGDNVDHIWRYFPDGHAILPDVDDEGRPASSRQESTTVVTKETEHGL